MTICDIEADTKRPAPIPVRAILDAATPAPAISPMKSSAPPTRIVLTGFMGAGKSTVGRLLADRLGWHFVDVDDSIVERSGMSIEQVFATYGEFVFRRMETYAIARALGLRNAVIALGGGAPEVLANRLLLEQTPETTVVFLDAPLDTLLARCNAQQEGVVRPNLSVAEERFRYRSPLYRRVARVQVETAGVTPAHTAHAVLQRLALHPGEAI